MILTILLVIIDQVSKYLIALKNVNITIINNILNFTYVENRGMIFGLAQGSVYVVGVISLIICMLLIWYIQNEKKNGRKVEFPIYIILAGGIGNVIDRIFRGYVIDFIDTPFIATFNLADSFVVIGIALMIITYMYKIIKKD